MKAVSVRQGFFASFCAVCFAVFFSVSLTVTVAVPTGAGEPDRGDLASVSLQPAYVSASQLRAGSCLHAVAFSPLDPNAPAVTPSVSYQEFKPVPKTIGIAVGEAGTILRSDDAGESWRPIENLVAESSETMRDPNQPTRRALDFFGTANRARQALAHQLVAMPLCEFSDVIWGSPRDVIVVGGGYEPVTGISRGVCVFSEDAGQTWRLADAHEQPRMRKVRIADRASLAATGDASEASGVNRFGSYDGGRTWVEDMLPTSDSVASGLIARSLEIETEQGTVSINAVCQTPDAVQIAVASHGRIFRRTAEDRRWRAVRGAGRQPAVLVVAASPAQVPWSLAGRETLQEQARTTLLIDGQPLNPKRLDRCRVAATMLGIGEVGVIEETTSRDKWLHEHRPAVIVLDDSLSPGAREAWLAAIENTRSGRIMNAKAFAGDSWNGPQRVVLSRPVGADSFPQWNPASWQRAWNHASVLRCNALLTGPGVLASDFSLDAAIMVAPGYPLCSGVEVATLEDVSGSIRRDVSLTAGVTLLPGQKREEAETATASHRRLQITTARMNQTSRLLDELRGVKAKSITSAEFSRLNQQIEQLLAVTAAEDRTRLLWEAFLEISRDRDSNNLTLRGMLLGLLSRHAEPGSIRRWATLAAESDTRSVELKMGNPVERFASRTSAETEAIANASQIGLPTDAPESVSPSVGNGQPISPFQIRPVSYEMDRNPAPQILVPATKPTVWQTTRGLPGLLSFPAANKHPDNKIPASAMPEPGMSGVAGSNPSIAPEPIARINWDYHPVVMGARGVEPISSLTPGVENANAKDASRTNNSAASYQPPLTAARPFLDGNDDDACWRAAELWGSEWLSCRCVADPDYLYFAINANRDGGVRLSLDCDGDYLTSFQFELTPEGQGRALVDAIGVVKPVWYSAIRRFPTDPALSSSSSAAGVEVSQWIAEIAIARSSLPAPVRRVHASLLADETSRWQVMPEPADWHPSRQSASER